MLGVLFSGGLVASALGVVTAVNPVHAVLLLVLSFVYARALWVVLGVEFRAFLLLAVYVGAVRVLFLFVVRRLNPQPLEAGDRGRHTPRAARLGGVFLLERLWLVRTQLGPTGVEEAAQWTDWVASRDSVSNLESLGQVIYTHRLVPFLRAGVVLLVARIGAIVLTVSVPAEDVRRQQVHEQRSRDGDRGIFLLTREDR